MTRTLLLLVAAVVPTVVPAAQPAPMPQPAGPVAFADVAAVADLDARSLPDDVAAVTRYLTAYHLPRAEREDQYTVSAYQVNSLSRCADIVPPRKVNAWLWAVRTDDYGWDAKVWERLRKANPHFAVRVKVTKDVEYTDGKVRPAEVDDFAPAPWLPGGVMSSLVRRTGSVTPIIPADVFFDLTSTQKGRDGFGYYDFLGLKTLADFDGLIRFKRSDAIDTQRENAAIVKGSGVAKFPRQVFLESAVTGLRAETRDTNDPAADGNAIDRLLEKFKFKAKEIIGTLPNGLPVTFLTNDKDERQDAAPPDIATNKESADNDHEVHVGTLTCFACHKGAYAPVSDYARRVYRPGRLELTIVDPAEYRRGKHVYLSPDFLTEFDIAQQRFEAKYKAATGLTGAALSAVVARRHNAYRVEGVTLAKAAARAGVTPAQLQDAVRRAGKRVVAAPGAPPVVANAQLDAVLADYGDDDPEPAHVDMFNERFGGLMLILGGVTP